MRPFEVPVLGNLWLWSMGAPTFVPLMYLQGVTREAVPPEEVRVHLELLKREDRGRAFLKMMRAFDPSMHGQGLGSPMTRAGLDWLAAQGIEHGMLYVESDNDPANRTYEKIGFHRHRTDRAYHRTIEP